MWYQKIVFFLISNLVSSSVFFTNQPQFYTFMPYRTRHFSFFYMVTYQIFEDSQYFTFKTSLGQIPKILKILSHLTKCCALNSLLWFMFIFFFFPCKHSVFTIYHICSQSHLLRLITQPQYKCKGVLKMQGNT